MIGVLLGRLSHLIQFEAHFGVTNAPCGLGSSRRRGLPYGVGIGFLLSFLLRGKRILAAFPTQGAGAGRVGIDGFACLGWYR
jgi:hypothetical protein